LRAKSHDQRKGQWLINGIRENDPTNPSKEDYERFGEFAVNNAIYANIERKLFNMENPEFDKLMEDYNK